MNDFEAPKELSSFIKWVLIGTKSQAIGNAREVTNTVATNVIAQQIMNNYKTDRQETYNPLMKDTKYRKCSETPLSVGLSLMVHKQTRSKKLVDTLSKLNLCIGYESTISLEKVLQLVLLSAWNRMVVSFFRTLSRRKSSHSLQ
jgi:hypothetical protein